ncbi:MAG: YbbR-like domain-containing protein [Proteobacteria bacterium]|jgi:YbbR domain-containing protein|nr:YbbR-like domain-containing protein [Pseudomonadota bacterium]
MPVKNPVITQTQELRRKKKRTLADRLKSNRPQKLLALACTLMLFVLVLSDRNMTMTFDEIPVIIRVPDGYAQLGGDTSPMVNVKIYGRASKLRQVTRDDLGTLSINPPAREGNVQITLHADMMSMPDGVKVEKFQPEFIGLNLEQIARRSIPLTTDHAFTGELAPGYQLGEIKLNPSEIEITGAKSLVDETTQLYIEPIDLTGKAASFTASRWAILNRAGVKATTTTRVEVSVNIVSKAKQHVVLGVPIEPINLSKAHEFVPPTIDLTLVGDEEALSKVDTTHLFVTIDAAADNTQPTHSRLIEQREIMVPNLPTGVGFDESKIPSILLKVTDDVPIQPPVEQAHGMQNAPADVPPGVVNVPAE